MSEFSGLFTAEPPKITRVDRVKRIVPPALIGVFFVLIGSTKFDGDPKSMWYQTFEQIGLGQWFRVFTGAMQVAGGLLMCVPKTMVAGAAMVAATMLGAVVVDLFVLGQPVFIVPFFLAVVVATVAMLCRE
jgi:putative oxidoreductase